MIGRQSAPKLASRIALAFIAVIVLAMTVSGVAVEHALRSSLDRALMDTGSEKLGAVLHIVEEQSLSLVGDQLHAIEDLLAGHPEIAVVLRSDSGMVARGTALPVNLPAVLEEAENQEGPVEVADGSYLAFTRRIHTVNKEKLQATVLVSTRSSRESLEAYRRIIVLATLGASVFGILISIGASRWTVQPLAKLSNAIGRLDPEQLSARLPSAEDAAELRSIREAVNQCLDRIERAYLQTEAFNADVAHELRTPLAATRLAIETVITSSQDNDTIDLLVRAQDQIDGLTGIVSDMLFVSQAQRGANARCEWVADGKSFLQGLVEFWEPMASEQSLVLRVTADGSVWIDPALMRRAVSNLISNALRYATANTEIEIRIEVKPNCWELGVSNLGAPISAEVQARMFDRFYRADTARQATATHHGLGLAIVAAVARMHGGTTFVECQGFKVTVGLRVPNPTIL